MIWLTKNSLQRELDIMVAGKGAIEVEWSGRVWPDSDYGKTWPKTSFFGWLPMRFKSGANFLSRGRRPLTPVFRFGLAKRRSYAYFARDATGRYVRRHSISARKRAHPSAATTKSKVQCECSYFTSGREPPAETQNVDYVSRSVNRALGMEIAVA